MVRSRRRSSLLFGSWGGGEEKIIKIRKRPREKELVKMSKERLFSLVSLKRIERASREKLLMKRKSDERVAPWFKEKRMWQKKEEIF